MTEIAVNDYLKLQAKQMSEAELQSNVLSLATQLRWSHYHTFNAIRSDPGWPDIVLCRPPQLIFVELKRQGKELTLPQLEWMARLENSGQRCYVWRPEDWLNGEIEKVLKGEKQDENLS